MDSPTYHVTPTLSSPSLTAILGKQVFFKMECYQPSGSFKLRGMDHLCQHHIAQGKQHFLASSGGNAGYSLAYAGKQRGVSVKVVVPETTGSAMIQRIRQLNAEVEIHGAVWDEAHEHALAQAKALDAVYVSPFDDPLLWQGHATMIEECAQQMPKPDALVVSVGGGGLLLGVFEGLRRVGWEDIQIITTETHGAASFKESHTQNALVTLDGINSVASSLGAKCVAEAALEQSTAFDVTPFSMPDGDAVHAARQFLDDHLALVEPACGAALSVPYMHPEVLAPFQTVLVIACGGVSTTLQQYQKWETEGLPY